MSDSLVSIIVPCYNGERFIDRCLGSIIRQDYPHLEVIIVNDGSTDQSEAHILAWNDRFSSVGKKLVYVYQENKGLGAAINAGLKHVTGDFLALIDVDDEFLESSISTKVDFLNSHCDVDVVRSNGWYNRSSGKSLFIYDSSEKTCSNLFAALVDGTTNNWAGSYMVRTSQLFSFYPDREIYPSRFGQNLQLLMPLSYKKACGYIDEPLMIYNIQENSLSQSADPKAAMEQLLKNAAGYLDIRTHLIDQIVDDPNEAQQYKLSATAAYYRLIFSKAVSLKHRDITKWAYLNLKESRVRSLDDSIGYYSVFCPFLTYPLRCVRKVLSIAKGKHPGRSGI